MEIDELGTFTYVNDGDSEYWKIEKPVLNLPNKFDFGAIAGSKENINYKAKDLFTKYANEPDKLYNFLNDFCYKNISNHISGIDADNIKNKFYIKSLTTTDKNNFEFGLQSHEHEVFVELFIRNGKFSEIYVDV